MKIKLIITYLLCVSALFAIGQTQITEAEYFYDIDPGVGNGVAISITSGTQQIINQDFSTTRLSEGCHSLFIRFKNNENEWSLSEGRRFYIRAEQVINYSPEIVAMEYFFDTDPGIDNAIPLSITSGTNLVLNEDISTSGLSVGFHSLFIRFQYANGQWSLSEGRRFYIRAEQVINESPEIVAMEYFIDADPGFGNGIPVTITSGDIVSLNLDIDQTGVPIGNYTLSFRVQDANGIWSIAKGNAFSIADCTEPTPDFSFTDGTVGEEIFFTDLSTNVDAGATYSWDIDDDGEEDYNTVGDISHTYTTAGEYNVSLTITNEGGCNYTNTQLLDIATGNIDALQQSNILMYPNPTNGIINFEFANNNIQKLSILDITGKIIIEKTDVGQNEMFDLSTFENGIFIIKIQTDNEIFTTKIIKE